MNTRQYDKSTRKATKRIQRHPEYQKVAERNRGLVVECNELRRDRDAANTKIASLTASLTATEALAEERAKQLAAKG